jgi:hypothetical protein
MTRAYIKLPTTIAMLLGALYPAAPKAAATDPMMANVIAWPDPRLHPRRFDDTVPAPPAGPWFDGPSWVDYRPASRSVQACGMLKNPLDTPVAVQFFSADLSSPLLLLPQEGEGLKRKPRTADDPPLPPPVPPPPMRFEVPRRSTVRICAETSLAAFELSPGGEARVRWYFGWKNPPAGYPGALQGVLTVRLP